MNKLLCSTLMLAVTTSMAMGQEFAGAKKTLVGHFVEAPTKKEGSVEAPTKEESSVVAPTKNEGTVAGQALVRGIIAAHADEPVARAILAGKAKASEVGGTCSVCHVGTTSYSNLAALMDYVDIANDDVPLRTTFSKPDSVTRSLLKLKDNEGIVVDGVCPSDKDLAALLNGHDIILAVDDEPVAKVQQVTNVLRTTKPLKITVLRQGQKEELVRQGKPSQTAGKQKRYLVGIMIGELSPVVVSQLQLDKSVSVFVKDFSDGSAAEAAGMKTNDIVLTVDGKVCDSSKMLQQQVQESEGKKLNFEVLRDGSTVQIEVAPSLIEATYIAVTETPHEAAAESVFQIDGTHLADVSPMIDSRLPIQAQLIPHQGITVYPPLNLASAAQDRAIHDQLHKIAQQLERVTKALEAMADEK